ncbi:hypothetical protein PTKIN_Ptkin09bG0031600 [Pterospermum kingtungense]
MENLPPDVIIEILSRLPVKSLCRFKCVCKLWQFLISHPKFVRRHINLTITDKEIEHQRRKLILNSCSLSSLYYVEYEALSSNHLMARELDLELIKSLHDEVKLVGSFNGLLCVSVGPERMFLFNPAMKELKKIPNLDGNIFHPWFSHISRPCIYGFGYDHSLDDYKVVNIVNEAFVYVYSLKTDTWRKAAQNFPYKSFNSDHGIPLNGAVHWVFGRGKNSVESSSRVIVAFDFAEGKLREVPLPSDAADSFNTVGVFGGCLCWLTCGTSTGTTAVKQYDFWVMSEYGIKESWTKVVINIPFLCLRPLSFLKNDEALLEIDGKLVLYNPKEGTHRELVIHGIHGRKKLEIQTYVESLVSPTLWDWGLKEICSSDEN